MTEVLKLGNFSGIQPENKHVSGMGAAVIPPFNNQIKSPQPQSGKLPDNVSLRILPTQNKPLDSTEYAKMYTELANFVDHNGKINLQTIHQNKKLMSNKSNDGSTTIENLYKIMTTPRAEGFDPKIILEETLRTLADPYIVTQDFGVIPEEALPRLIDAENKRVAIKTEEAKNQKSSEFERKPILKPLMPYNELRAESIMLAERLGIKVSENTSISEILYRTSLILAGKERRAENNPQKAAVLAQLEEKNQTLVEQLEAVNFRQGHTCPGASIEFDLADKKPAEFARYVEGLTSPARSVKTKIKYSNIANDLPAAVSKLYDWKMDYKPINGSNIELTLRPDNNAYPRAVIQEYGRANNSRSTIDTLLQSTFMQIGSGKTYNSLTDLRSEDTGHGRGLNQEEGAFVESIIDYDDGKDSVTYMNLDDDLTKVMSYNFNPQATEAMLTETLKNNKNIMVGFLTDVDENGNLVTENGHEILLTGLAEDESGTKYFRYNDTDDGDHYEPSYIPVKELIRTLHHANLPKSITRKYIGEQDDQRLMLVQDLWQLKNQNAANTTKPYGMTG